MRDQHAVPDQVQPCIADLLRTWVHPATIALEIERIVTRTSAPTTDAPNFQPIHATTHQAAACHLLLTDRVLTIQALLRPSVIASLGPRDLVVGDVLELKQFEVSKAKRLNGSGQVIFLGIRDASLVHRERSGETVPGAGVVKAPHVEARPSAESSSALEGGFIREKEPPRKKVRFLLSAEEDIVDEMASQSSQESDAGFETIAVDLATVRKRRQALRGFTRAADQTSTKTAISPASHYDKPKNPNTSPRLTIRPRASVVSHAAPLVENITQAVPLELEVRTTQHSTSELPMHTLASLLHSDPPLPKKNYVCSVLAVVSWVSASIIHKPNSPFPPKRHVKLHDPSIATRHAGVTLVVFVDAKTFLPAVGTVALFRGVVMQRWQNEAILNAYERLKTAQEAWYISEKVELRNMGHDVDGLLEWWKSKSTTKAIQNQS